MWGMNVVNRSGIPGYGAIINLRGVNSLHASSSPLYVIDGVPLSSFGIFGSNLAGYAYNPLLTTNPFDISRTTIVKDPALTAAYGSKASNGLIIIETLDPSVTETSIELNIRTGYSLAPSNLIPQLNGGQHKTLMNEVLFSSGLWEEQMILDYPSLFLEEEDAEYIDYQHDTYWQELIFRNSSMYNANLEVKGGDEIARYGLSFGYQNNKGIIKDTDYSGYNLRFVSRLNIFTWLKMNATVSLNNNSSYYKEAATVKETSPILTSLAKSPLLNPYQYDIEGRLLSTLANVDELGTSNPLATIQNYQAENSNNNFISSLGFEAGINDHLNLNTRFSLYYDVLKEQIFMPNRGMELYYNKEAINVSKATNNSLSTLYNNTYLNYNRTFSNNHRISSHTGLNIQTNNYELDWGLTKNAHQNDEYRSLQDGTSNLREIGGLNSKWNWMSVYENLHYTYKDKYLFTASFTLDGSSRVGKNADNTLKIADIPVGLFYSGGFAWRLSDETFLKNTFWLEDLKIRVTAGKTGNDDIGEASATNYYQTVKFRETAGLYPAVLHNDRLSYETVSQINTGLDLSVLGNRFAVNVDYFISTINNMLIFSPVEAYLGYEYRMDNGGSMSNKGWEFSTFVRLLDLGNFRWDIQANLFSVKNEILEITSDKFIFDVEGGEKVVIPGSPVYSFYGYNFQGVFATQEEAANAGLVNDKNLPFQAGDAIFEDISGPLGAPDSIINEFDKTTIGSSLPDLTGSISTALSFKRLTLSAQLYFVHGNEIFNYVRYKNEAMSGLENQSQNVLNRWQYNGQQTNVPRAVADDQIGNSSFSSRWIEDGSYLRLNNVTLSYKLPQEFLVFDNAEFYISVNNVLTLSNYLGYDPEFAYSYSQIHQGIDYGLAPQCRQFIAGIKIGL